MNPSLRCFDCRHHIHTATEAGEHHNTTGHVLWVCQGDSMTEQTTAPELPNRAQEES